LSLVRFLPAEETPRFFAHQSHREPCT
jgi:hypothetical protein